MVKQLPVHQADTTTELKLLLERIRQEGNMKALFYKETVSLCLVQLLYMLCRKGSLADVNQPGLPSIEHPQMTNEPTEAAKLVESYIKEHYSESLTLEGRANLLQ
jgi:hypothetical protein